MLQRLSRLLDRLRIVCISPVEGSINIYLPKSNVLCSSSSTCTLFTGVFVSRISNVSLRLLGVEDNEGGSISPSSAIFSMTYVIGSLEGIFASADFSSKVTLDVDTCFCSPDGFRSSP